MSLLLITLSRCGLLGQSAASFSAFVLNLIVPTVQMELPDQPHPHRSCCLHQHGHSGHIPRGRQNSSSVTSLPSERNAFSYPRL